MNSAKLEFSLWCDFIQRAFLESEFLDFLKEGRFFGATSNPTIFAHALKASEYRKEIQNLVKRLFSSKSLPLDSHQLFRFKSVYEDLACKDIEMAALALYPIHHLFPLEGYISIEIDPFLENNVTESVEEGLRLYRKIGHRNVMIKVPATESGYEVMEELIARGICVNATLVFSISQVLACAEAFKRGYQRYGSGVKNKMVMQKIQGVISVFVSRFDRELNSKLEPSLHMKVGIANALLCYESLGLVPLPQGLYVRILFASTGVKKGSLDRFGKVLPQDYYIKALKLPNSINTAPLESINFHFDNLNSKENLYGFSKDVSEGIREVTPCLFDEARDIIKGAEDLGVNFELVCKKLVQDGLESFKANFLEILNQIKDESSPFL